MPCHDKYFSTLHAEKDQEIVEPAADLLAELCDKDEFCDTSISSPQLEVEHSIVPLLLPNIFQVDENNSIECIEEIEQEHPPLELEKNDRAAPTTLEENKEGNAGGARIPQGKLAPVEMKLSPYDANLQQSLVASFATLSFRYLHVFLMITRSCVIMLSIQQ
jgi:hypothetical protein